MTSLPDVPGDVAPDVAKQSTAIEMAADSLAPEAGQEDAGFLTTFLGDLPSDGRAQSDTVVEISESDTIVHIRARFPGVAAQNISMMMRDGCLVLRDTSNDGMGAGEPFLEGNTPTAETVLPLPDYIQLSKAMVTREHDTLHVHIPKKRRTHGGAGAAS